MTKQEIFDTVVKGILSQGGASGKMLACRYRNQDGRKCAAGHLIPDVQFHKNMEGLPFNDVCKKYKLGFNEIEIEVIMRLQAIHDDAAWSSTDEEFFNKWKPHMIMFAIDEGLNFQKVL